jgi:hypothetical protein
MDARARRLGENEILYREVNERVRELSEQFGLQQEEVGFVCECAQLECSARITLTLPEYEQLRAHPRRFAVVDGHEQPEVERVLERRARYTVIEKLPGGPAELAEAADPR